MRIARIAVDGRELHARADGDAWVPIEDPYAAFAAGTGAADTGERVDGCDATLLAPALPTVLVGIAQNRGAEPEPPLPVQAWLKSPRGVVPHGTTVRVRREAGRVVAEAEIAVVIGRDTGDPGDGLVTEANAHEFVLGVTAVNDLSYPDRAALDVRNFESKGGDGSTPLGPWINTEASIDDLVLRLEVDGEVVCDSSAQEMPVPVRESIAYVARWLRLGPGDVIMAGAPHSSHEVAAGSTVSVVVGGLRLETPLR
ncbi:fumarylacetoacetate hydrolase family protein [Arthrobacter sp. Sa2CUA1]|uniref:Fumarylacetoacetate hydrolase family protein n=1 Tax=Arthrobacter gallicola TaxID=2762225 RepID=A0ABR8UUM0_9MICC|nr:fumarylacetoacetate hydrolase family protein [Arthrobacter gallicola]MBD7996224.1 fumarylacetoacetate hydrolase family protein [Arthrobacter gallicola]